MSIAYVPDFAQAPFACIVAPDGECVEYKKLPNLLRRKNAYREEERLMKVGVLFLVVVFTGFTVLTFFCISGKRFG